MYTYAGNGVASFINGPDSAATFNYPRGLVVSNISGKKVYVVDYNNHAIRLITSSDPTGISETIVDDDLTIFPNPSNGSFFISLNKSNDLLEQIEIFNLQGIKVYCSSLIRKKDYFFNMENYSSGIYFISCKMESGTRIIKKVCVQ